jgi:F-type H+-transporting ATPase subunit delta
MLDGLAAAMEQDTMRALLTDPRVKAKQAHEVIESLLGKLGASGDKDMNNFVTQLHDSGRLLVAPEISRQYANLRNAAEGVLEAEIHTAFELDNKRVKAIAERLKERFSMREVNTKVIKDESLTGGIIIKAGDNVIDASISAELDQLRNILRRG